MHRVFFSVFLLSACTPTDPLLGKADSGDPSVIPDSGVLDDTGDTEPEPEDNDGDGFAADVDCDDADAAINPGADEVCDGADNDCDGGIDGDAIDAAEWYTDADQDGYGADGAPQVGCEMPAAAAAVAGDCDDADAAINPDAEELCDGIDNDCAAGTTEEGMVSWYESATEQLSDVSDVFAAGTFSAPISYTTKSAGRLSFCGGRWYASLDIQAPTLVRGMGAPDENVISGAWNTTPLLINANTALRDITITEGDASSSGRNGLGGAMYCDSGATITMRDAVVSYSEGTTGGAMYIDTCPISIYDSEITNNNASQYGAIALARTTAYIENTTVSDNNGQVGGAMFVSNYSYATGGSGSMTLDMVDTLFAGNTALYYGAVMLAHNYSTATTSNTLDITCEKTKGSSQGGFLGNTHTYTYNADYAAALYFANFAGTLTFESAGCDFGDDGASDDNDPLDIFIYENYPSDPTNYRFDNGTSLVCDNNGCL